MSSFFTDTTIKKGTSHKSTSIFQTEMSAQVIPAYMDGAEKELDTTGVNVIPTMETQDVVLVSCPFL